MASALTTETIPPVYLVSLAAFAPYNGSVSGGGHYSEEEVEQILKLAARQTHGSVDDEQLLRMAGELGISPEAVKAAAEQVRAENGEKRLRAEFEKHQLRDLWSHIGAYIIVNGAMMAMNFLHAGRITWAWWPLVVWGIAIAFSLWETFARGSEDHEEEYQKWLKKTGSQSLQGAGTTSGRFNSSAELLDEHVESILLRENLTKLEAIKRLREQTGSTLKDAKDAVEEYERRNPGVLRG